MKKIICIFLSFLFLLAFQSCGSDEPDNIEPISCLAHYTSNKGASKNIRAFFYLYPGTGYSELVHGGEATSMVAKKSDGQEVTCIGWCSTTKERSSIIPTYTSSGSNFDAIQEGTFTIFCVTYEGGAYPYMSKTFSKKRGEKILIDAHFTEDDLYTYTEIFEWKRVAWK